jgi:hypothetical protein
MAYDGEIHRGVWAGDPFDIVDLESDGAVRVDLT